MVWSYFSFVTFTFFWYIPILVGNLHSFLFTTLLPRFLSVTFSRGKQSSALRRLVEFFVFLLWWFPKNALVSRSSISFLRYHCFSVRQGASQHTPFPYSSLCPDFSSFLHSISLNISSLVLLRFPFLAPTRRTRNLRETYPSTTSVHNIHTTLRIYDPGPRRRFAPRQLKAGRQAKDTSRTGKAGQASKLQATHHAGTSCMAWHIHSTYLAHKQNAKSTNQNQRLLHPTCANNLFPTSPRLSARGF